MNWLRLAIQWSTSNRANTNLNKSVYAARRSFTSHHAYFSLLQPCRKHQKYIAQIMLASYLSMPGVLLAQGVSAAANSVHAPGFDTAANGTPIVNINAPSSKGVSRNEYNELNVDTKGLIFNNATDIVNTQLAGFIDGNSRLNGNTANIILNEVKGNSRSALNGYMEIAGRSAELVIANQNGITCNGCGFINTTRGTLTTGLPTFDGAGGLTGFDVSRGDVDISGLGLNASNVDEVDILARSVSLNSKFWAKNATIVTGQNHIKYQDKKVTAAVGSSGSGISLDVAAIGGMYANRIRLIGTEKGLGVNVAGEIKAVEDMTLDSQGNLSNSGTISAKTLAVSSKGINNTGSVLGNAISIDADLLDNNTKTANIQAVNSVSIKLKDGLKNRDGARVLSEDGLISIESGSVSNQSSVAANRILVNAGSLTNNTSDGQIISSGTLDLTLTGNANNTDGAMIHADKALTLNTSGDLTNTDATIETVDTAIINSQNLTSSGTILAEKGTLTVKSNKVDNQGTLAGNGITINATDLKNSTVKGEILSSDTLDLTLTGNANNTDGAMIHADKVLTLNASGDLTNTDATIETVDTAIINSQNLTSSGTILAEKGTLTVKSNKVDNQGALAGNGITINATDLKNSTTKGKIQSSDTLDLTLTGNADNTDGAMIHADKALTFNASGDLINTDATIETVDTAIINSQNLTSSGTILAENGTLTVKSNKVDNQGALAGNGITINATDLKNSTAKGEILSSDTLDLTLTGNANNTDGAMIHADKALTLNASGDLTNTDATIETVDTAIINSQNLTSSGTILAENGTLTVKSNKVDNQGKLAGNGITLTATDLKNSTAKGKILSSDTLDLTLTGNANNTDGAMIHADKALTLNASGDLTNTDATIETVDTAIINSQNLTSSGTILAENGTLTVKTNKVDNQGTLAGNGIAINAKDLKNSTAKGKILSAGKVDIVVTGDVDNTEGALVHGGTHVNLDVKGNLTNSNATIEAIESVTIASKNMASTGTILAKNGVLTVVADKVDNQGAITGNGITITTDALDNSSVQGRLYSTDTLVLNVDGTITNKNKALIHSDKALSVTSTKGNILNTDATMETATQATLTSNNITNSGTILAQGNTLTIRTQQIDNQGLLGGDNIDIKANVLNNTSSNGRIYANKDLTVETTGAMNNTNGSLIHGGNLLTLKATGNLANTNATIESVGSIDLTALNLSNSSGSKVLAKNGGLTIKTNILDNQGSLSGHGLDVNAALVNNNTSSSRILSSKDLTLTTQASFSNVNGAQVKANNTLTINSQGDINNTGSLLQSVNNITLNSRNLNNASTGTISAQNGTPIQVAV